MLNNLYNGGSVKELEKGAAIGSVLSLSGEIAHELRTPLAIIQMYTELLENVSRKQDVDSSNLQRYSEVVKNTICETNSFIDSFLLQIRYISSGNVAKSKSDSYSMFQSIKEAVHKFPFKSGERDVVKCTLSSNFEYTGEKILMIHLLYNLIKNALIALANRNNSFERDQIQITCSKAKKYGVVTITDNAGCLAIDKVKEIFEAFTGENISYRNGGIGLHFCHLVMNSVGGTIECKVNPGRCTSFIMHFPL